MKIKLLLLTGLFFVNFFLNGQNTNFGNPSGNLGIFNSSFGYKAGILVTGYNNSFFGTQSGKSNTTGGNNVFLGHQTGYFNNIGSGNVFSGYKSGYSNSSGSYNIFTGYDAGTNNTIGHHNIFTGREAGQGSQTGEYNIFIGDESGNTNNGIGNTFIGRQTGNNNSAGNYNLAIGYKAGYHSSGSNNVFLGYKAGSNQTNSNRLYIDNSETTTPLIYGKFDTDQLGINTNIIPAGYTMAVKGKFITEEIKVQTYANWPDFVFKKEYNLPSLKEVENYINTNGHLKNIPSACEVSENGILLGEMNAKLLQKIEELTLYIIQQEARFNDQEARLKKLESGSK
ncbi:hypothetical protein [Flavobacterium sp. CF136]|uniref:hypothetical protein n=1 Tax=Flavobacterium sp. (strain CF136) TaxID=1144313 RepID=UPI0002716C01|nr:hypothetical protein [Flavobacterium sp. CF136]EJL60660.1 hypothetical protein PMI10_03718 [Flavobacterium sp. CF136]